MGWRWRRRAAEVTWFEGGGDARAVAAAAEAAAHGPPSAPAAGGDDPGRDWQLAALFRASVQPLLTWSDAVAAAAAPPGSVGAWRIVGADGVRAVLAGADGSRGELAVGDPFSRVDPAAGPALVAEIVHEGGGWIVRLDDDRVIRPASGSRGRPAAESTVVGLWRATGETHVEHVAAADPELAFATLLRRTAPIAELQPVAVLPGRLVPALRAEERPAVGWL